MAKANGLTDYYLSAAGHSTTNVQVAGVDEPDFVKNDGKYIYVISGNKLEIINAYPPGSAKIVSETTIDGSPANLFVNGDRLVVFITANENAPIPLAAGGSGAVAQGISGSIAAMPYRYAPVTHALIYSIRDRSHPRLENDLKVDGSYFDARMIGNWVYLISKEPVNSYDGIVVPAVFAGQEKLLQPDVYYFKNPETSYVFHTVTAFNVNGGTNVRSKTFLMGWTNNLYVSENNLYISYPLQSVYAQPSGLTTTGAALAQQEGAFNSLGEAEKQSYINGIKDGSAADTTRTVIHKIAIHDGAIDYVARGEVGGTLLNQFSLDEHGGLLRVATTSTSYTPYDAMQQYNNVYVLDQGMGTRGSLRKIAPNERIYAARFIGDRLYLVTYRNIDPLFVIDLSNGRSPRILGELKITGYSNFLYPYDATHLIGIGRETKDNGWGGVTNSGVKIALFDVADVSRPKVVDSYEIGDSQTYSDALNEHKAILLDPGKGILVLPVSQTSSKPTVKSMNGYYQPQYWDGAYVFGLSKNGFTVKGTVTQDDSSSYYGMDSVKRSLYIGNGLYTVSAQKIVISDLRDLREPLGEISLSGYAPIHYGYDY